MAEVRIPGSPAEEFLMAAAPRRPDRHLLGAEGERRAAEALTQAGYEIVEANARAGLGELDLVARDDGCWVFVEVKTRRGTAYGSGSEALTLTKQRRLLRAARAWLEAHELEDVDWRFDVVAVTLPASGAASIDVIRNAFGD
jgi:putative endonuclease